ncbi:mechanosensitive ion channel domain-containing protein [Novispirillum sp. DQ9]|uniref:mechanosensitive ion channel domain-containing protein n=1 Tax=Novispirillum sp. DQ9 TaxID=3398612 RepID=UPI003C7E60E5
MFGVLRAAMVALMLVLVAAGTAQAQDSRKPAATAEALTTAQLESLISTLENDQQRKQFLATLKSAVEAHKAATKPAEPGGLGVRLLGGLSAAVASVSQQLAQLAAGATRLPQVADGFARALDTPSERANLLNGLIGMAVVTVVGLLAAWITHRLLARPARMLKARPGAKWLERSALVTGRMILALIPPLVLAVAAWGVLPLLGVGPRLLSGLTAFIAALATYRAVVGVSRALLAPADDSQRVLPLSGETGHYLMIWIARLAAVGLFGGFLLHVAVLAGLPAQSHALLMKLLGLLVAAMCAILVLQNRQAVAAWLRRDSASPPPGEARRRPAQRLRQRISDVWHVVAILYIIVLYVVWAADVPGGFTYLLRATALTVVIIAAALGLARLLGLAMARAFRISADNKAQFPGLEERANRYMPILHTILRVVLTLVTVLAVLEVWGLETITWLTAGPGQRLTGAVLSIAVVLVLAFLAWSLVSSAIERYLSETDADGTVVARSARAKTLLPLARNVFMIMLLVVVGLIVLSEVGVNIAPLLAGAGVIGLAIGFGSQKLVQDIITGAFILMEDTIAVGDVVAVGGHSGVVEALTIRSLRLRDATGNVHTIPFSTVDKVTNMTKEFSYAVLDIGVAYREDTDEVFAVMREVADDLRADAEFGPLILEPLEVQGVDAFMDSSVLLKARLKTKPVRQWAVRREYNRRLKKAFDARGIEIPFPQSTVWFGEDKQGNAPAGRMVVRHTGAAQPAGAEF